MHYMTIGDARQGITIHGNLFSAGYRVNYTHFVDIPLHISKHPPRIQNENKGRRWNGLSLKLYFHHQTFGYT